MFLPFPKVSLQIQMNILNFGALLKHKHYRKNCPVLKTTTTTTTTYKGNTADYTDYMKISCTALTR